MTVERFLGFAEAKGVDLGNELEESLKKYQAELELRVKTKVSDNETNIGPSVLMACKKVLCTVPVKGIWIENTEGTKYENSKLETEEGKEEVFAFALNGWAATYRTDGMMTLIRVQI